MLVVLPIPGIPCRLVLAQEILDRYKFTCRNNYVWTVAIPCYDFESLYGFRVPNDIVQDAWALLFDPTRVSVTLKRGILD